MRGRVGPVGRDAATPCEPVPAAIAVQVSRACTVIDRHLAPALRAIHLFGSALDGGLKPRSDIDLLVTVDVRLDESVRRALMRDLLEVSAPPGENEACRALEVTVVVRGDVGPWRHPARRELQFGEWLRQDLLAGVFEPPVLDVDLAILLTKAMTHSVALTGPAAQACFDPVPASDFRRALAGTLAQWVSAPDWAGDERNVVLALARIWFSAATGAIAPKDVAADWAMSRLPDEHRPVLFEAQQAYLGDGEDRLASQPARTERFIRFVKSTALGLLEGDVHANVSLSAPP